MTSKKSLIVFSYVLFVSLCSPIRTETTKTEHIVRAIGYGFWGIMTSGLNYEDKDRSVGLACIPGMFATNAVIDSYYPESNRVLIGLEKRGCIGLAAYSGGKAGSLLGTFVVDSLAVSILGSERTNSKKNKRT